MIQANTNVIDPGVEDASAVGVDDPLFGTLLVRHTYVAAAALLQHGGAATHATLAS